jgi:Serine phosphatase RsbU, regulator of sigma subunit
MASGEQSAEFLCLLDGVDEFVQEYRPISFNSEKSMKYAGVALEDGGFVQIAYNAERFRQDIDQQVLGATKNRHVGENGYILIISEDGEIVSCPDKSVIGEDISVFDGLTVEKLRPALTGEPFEGSFRGTTYRCLADMVEGYFIFALIPKEEMLSSMMLTYIMTNFLEAMTFILLFMMIYILIKGKVSDNVEKVDRSLNDIVAGDLDVRVDVRGTEEFENLSANINTTVGYLKDLVAQEAERIDKELEYAKNIQRSALPSLFPPFPDRDDFEIYASMDPAKEVGGDFFDFELLDGKLLGFCVADVSGKGIPAALFMMRAKTLIKSYGIAGLHADEILYAVNNELCTNNEAGMFVTCWLGILNTETGVVEYANAGHNPPLVCRSNGDFEYLKENRACFILAGMEDVKYRRHELLLDHGDEIFLYTDGVTEATDINNVLYGEERLQKALNAMKSEDCTQKCKLLRGSIDEFVGEAPQFDDITMLSLKYN